MCIAHFNTYLSVLQFSVRTSVTCIRQRSLEQEPISSVMGSPGLNGASHIEATQEIFAELNLGAGGFASGS